MFHQFVADGGNLFVAIVAVLVGFAAAMGYTDALKTRNDKNSPYDKKD